MTLSTGPWWWAPVFALGWMTTVPAQSFSAPARAWVMAAARFMPGVWAVLMSSSLAWTTRTPSNFHLGSCWLIGASGAAHYGAAGALWRAAPRPNGPMRDRQGGRSLDRWKRGGA